MHRSCQQRLTCCLFMVAPGNQLSPASPCQAASFIPLRYGVFRKCPVTSLHATLCLWAGCQENSTCKTRPLHKSLNGLSLVSSMQFKFLSMSFQAIPSPISKYFSCTLLEDFLSLCFSHRFLPHKWCSVMSSCFIPNLSSPVNDCWSIIYLIHSWLKYYFWRSLSSIVLLEYLVFALITTFNVR